MSGWRMGGGRHRDLEVGARGLGRGSDVREVVAWLCQQFSGRELAFWNYNWAVEVKTYWILAVSAMVNV